MSKFGTYKIEPLGKILYAYIDGAQSLSDTRAYFDLLQSESTNHEEWALFVNTSSTAVGTPDAVEYSLSFLPKLKSLGCKAYVIHSQNALVKSYAEFIAELVQVPFMASSNKQELQKFVTQSLSR